MIFGWRKDTSSNGLLVDTGGGVRSLIAGSRSGFVLEHYCNRGIVNAETELKAYKTNELNFLGPEFMREMAL
jgi:hypothetical protein